MRKQFIVKKEMQFKLIFTVVLLFLLIFVISSCNIYLLMNYFISQLSKQSPEISQAISDIFVMFRWRLLLIVGVNIVIVILIGILFTHQIAGPAYNIERVLTKMAEGNLALRVKLRKNDQLSNLEEVLNLFLEKHRERLRKIKVITIEVNKLATKCKNNNEDTAELARLSEQLEKEIVKIKIEEQD
ncbi:hypothetical protein KAJ27_15760 [bacterium]|nr:hypothetical protein [bacterium]